MLFSGAGPRARPFQLGPPWRVMTHELNIKTETSNGYNFRSKMSFEVILSAN